MRDGSYAELASRCCCIALAAVGGATWGGISRRRKTRGGVGLFIIYRMDNDSRLWDVDAESALLSQLEKFTERVRVGKSPDRDME